MGGGGGFTGGQFMAGNHRLSYSHLFFFLEFRVPSLPRAPVFGLWEEAGILQPTHACRTQGQHAKSTQNNLRPGNPNHNLPAVRSSCCCCKIDDHYGGCVYA